MNSCVFAVRTQDLGAARERIAWLTRLYAPLDPTDARQWWFPDARTLLGVMAFAGSDPLVSEEAGGVLIAWGGPVPDALGSPGVVLDASDSALRALDRTVALFAARARRSRIVGAASGPVTIYAAGSRDPAAWSTHAAAASVLGRGAIEIDWEAVPESLAANPVGGTDTHWRGVRAFPSAWLADVEGGEPRERSYWPARERWRLQPEEDAYRCASEALLEGIERRISPGVVHCALTGGLDSRVVAIALREIGKETVAFTYGHPDWPDAVEARRVAATLGMAHEACGFDWRDDDSARELILRSALWSDGGDPAHGFALPREPASMRVSVTGHGGETGRAWYYGWLARDYRSPSPDQLARVLGHLHRRIADAAPEVHDQLDVRIRRRVTELQADAGLEGWRTLDALYEEWRGRRFVRARLSRSHALTVGGFNHPELSRALVSLPLAERVGAGFHRRFIAEREPALAVPPPARTIGRFAPRAALRLRHRLAARRPPVPTQWLLAERWPDYPRTREWLEDAVLGDPAARAALGGRWMDRLRAGFTAGESHATELALRLAAMIALEQQGAVAEPAGRDGRDLGAVDRGVTR